MISFGVPAGASSPIEPVTVMLGNPSSAAVGSSGAATNRFGLVTARIRILPVLWSSRSWPVTPGVPMGTWPPIRSLITGPVPRYGTGTMPGVPASDLNNSPVRCWIEPTPASVGQLAGIGFRIGDELVERPRLHRRMHRDAENVAGHT